MLNMDVGCVIILESRKCFNVNRIPLALLVMHPLCYRTSLNNTWLDDGARFKVRESPTWLELILNPHKTLLKRITHTHSVLCIISFSFITNKKRKKEKKDASSSTCFTATHQFIGTTTYSDTRYLEINTEIWREDKIKVEKRTKCFWTF